MALIVCDRHCPYFRYHHIDHLIASDGDEVNDDDTGFYANGNEYMLDLLSVHIFDAVANIMPDQHLSPIVLVSENIWTYSVKPSE